MNWYHSILQGDERRAYETLLNGMLSFEKEVAVPKMTYKRIGEISELVRLDDPMIFYVSGTSYRSSIVSDSVTVVIEYSFDKNDIKSMTSGLKKRIDRILCKVYDLDDIQKLTYIRNWILNSVTYEKLKRQYSHEIYGVLSHGIGVCEGIAKTVKVMCDALEIPAVIVIGKEDSNGVRHAWNIISLYGKERHYDFTFDLSLKESGLKPKYWSMTDEQIYRDHSAPVYQIPVCD